VITVVVCAYTADRWTRLESCVASVERQEPPPEIVIVVDHNDALLTRAQGRWPHLAVIPNRRTRGLSGARNTGIAASAGEFIAFIDDDARADDGWLQLLTDPFHDPKVGVTGGLVVPDFEGDRPKWFPDEYLWVVGCSYSGQPRHPQVIRNPIGANMAFRRDVFLEVGAFAEGIGRIGARPLGCEETELAIRAGRRDFVVWYEPRAVVRHAVPAERMTARYFVRRCFAEGLSKAAVASAAGVPRSLETETGYVVRVLSGGVRAAIADVVKGPARSAAAGRGAALVAGVATAALGFVVGAARGRRLPEPAPVLWPAANTH
jgi:glycosyltransferase involved in cell wall biosynthesis